MLYFWKKPQRTDAMNTFCTGKDLAAQRTRVRRRTVLFLGLCLLALLLFVMLCLITRTDNAAGTLRSR
jgi:hypothetical protein